VPNESHPIVAHYFWACDQKNTDPSGSSSDPGNLAGTDPTYNRGFGHGRSGRTRNLFVHVCDDQGVRVRTQGNELARGYGAHQRRGAARHERRCRKQFIGTPFNLYGIWVQSLPLTRIQFLIFAAWHAAKRDNDDTISWLSRRLSPLDAVTQYDDENRNHFVRSMTTNQSNRLVTEHYDLMRAQRRAELLGA
jgi:hypothetical protein